MFYSVLSGTHFLPPLDCPENWCGALARDSEIKHEPMFVGAPQAGGVKDRLVSVFTPFPPLLSARRLSTRGPER